MNVSPPGFSVHAVFQARIPERVAVSFCRGPSQPRGWTHVSWTGRQILFCWATWEAHTFSTCSMNCGCGDLGWDLPEPGARNSISLWPCSLGLAVTWLACVQLPGTQRWGVGWAESIWKALSASHSLRCCPLKVFSSSLSPPHTRKPGSHWTPIPWIADPAPGPALGMAAGDMTRDSGWAKFPALLWPRHPLRWGWSSSRTHP